MNTNNYWEITEEENQLPQLPNVIIIDVTEDKVIIK